MFKNFYLAKHSGRILTLQPGAGTADLNAVFYGGKRSEEEDKEEAGAAGGTAARGGHKKHILNVNTYQMVVLLMFNTRERLTYEEIKEVSSGLFGTDPDWNRVTWETPSGEAIPFRRKPLRHTRLLRDPALRQV